MNEKLIEFFMEEFGESREEIVRFLSYGGMYENVTVHITEDGDFTYLIEDENGKLVRIPVT